MTRIFHFRYGQGWLTAALVVFALFALMALGQSGPPMPPGFVPTKQAKVYTILSSPKAATVQASAPMAKGTITNYTVLRTCTVVRVASECTNVAAWKITPLIASYIIESSTDNTKWEELFSSRYLCYFVPVSVTVFYPIDEKKRFFRVRPI